MLSPYLGVNENNNFKVIRPLSSLEYDQLVDAKKRLIQFSHDQQLFQIVRTNHKDFWDGIDRHLQEYVTDQTMTWQRLDRVMLDVNRLLLNLLSSIRTFLDHTETNLKKRYGDTSIQYRNFRNACVAEYDNNFSYRFLYKLRNFAQHCGFPVGEIVFNSTKESATNEGNHTVSVLFIRDYLLSGYDSWTSKIKADLEALPPKFELNDYINDVMACLDRINIVVIEDDLKVVIQNADFIDTMISPIKNESGTPCIMFHNLGEQEGQIRVEWLPLHLVQIVRDIKSILPPDFLNQ